MSFQGIQIESANREGVFQLMYHREVLRKDKTRSTSTYMIANVNSLYTELLIRAPLDLHAYRDLDRIAE
jgi:hypothetical protein